MEVTLNKSEEFISHAEVFWWNGLFLKFLSFCNSDSNLYPLSFFILNFTPAECLVSIRIKSFVGPCFQTALFEFFNLWLLWELWEASMVLWIQKKAVIYYRQMEIQCCKFGHLEQFKTTFYHWKTTACISLNYSTSLY